MTAGPGRGRQSLPLRKTRIVATLGPASRDPAVLERMIRAGMNVARINFAHGTAEQHRAAVGSVREISARVGCRVAVFGDLPGPKIRIGKLHREPIQLETGRGFVLQAEPMVGGESGASVSFDRLAEVVTEGDEIFLNDGFIQLRVESVADAKVHCRVEVGGELRSHKGVNFPSADLGIRAFTDQDHEFLRLAAELELDGVSQSFVQDAADIEAVRSAASRIGFEPFVIAKIERASALEHLEAILAAADGIMVARGDLGVETPIERIALEQKRIIAAARRAAVPVITATHMLESMTEHTRPTRAEATDVANAILDGSDCVMLSGETAIGLHPVEAVHTVARIAEETEGAGIPSRATDHPPGRRWVSGDDPAERLSTSAFEFITGLQPAIVVSATTDGRAPRLITRFRIEPWIVAITPEERVCRQLLFSYGVHAVREEDCGQPFQGVCRRVLGELGVGGDLALLLLPGDVSGDARVQQLQILEM